MKKIRLVQSKMRDGNGELQVLNPEDARRTIAYVNRKRMMLAERLNDLALFVDPPPEDGRGTFPKLGDHPALQVVFALKKELDRLDAGSSDMEERKLRVQVLGKIADLTNQLSQEAYRSSVEIQNMLSRSEDMAQRKLEHADKMRVMENKLRGGAYEPTDAELEEASKAPALAEPSDG